MKNVMIALVLTLSAAFAPMTAFADATPGKAAPAFEVTDANGKVQKLSDYTGKWLVLEWTNHECPYVKKHYGSGNMQKLQAQYTGKGVVWLTVASSAKGKEGYLAPADLLKTMTASKAASTATLVDVDGKMGKAYGAKTTPHMFVIDPKGTVVYAGAIDNNDSADPAVIKTSTNYVAAALDAGMANKKIETASTRAYGCGVKY